MLFVVKASIVLFYCCLLTFSAVAQQEGADAYKMAVRLNLAPPHPIANKAFRNTFTGAYTIGAEFEFNLLKFFYVAPAFGHTAFRVPPRKIADRLKTTLILDNGGLKIGYKNYFTEKVFWAIAVGGGGNFSHYKDVQAPDSIPVQKTFSASYLQAEFSLNFYTEDNFTIGLYAGYTFLTHDFNPKEAAFNLYKIYDSSELNGNLQYIDIGFSLRYMLVKKK